MNAHKEEVWIKQCETAVKALRANRIDARLARTRDELFALIRELIPAGAKVSSGGSQTLLQCGAAELLDREFDYYFRGRKREDGSLVDSEREAFHADWFVSSANAVTLNGELYFRDGNGNRLAAVAFGPKNVLIIAGANKLVRDLHAAEERVMMTAAPANCVRLDKNTGCRKTGYCVNCKKEERICSLTLTCAFQQNAWRIHVILLPEELGF